MLPAALAAAGWKDRIEYGTEWGYSATILNDYHYNYYSEGYGSRIDSREREMTYKSNGHLYAFAGYRFTNWMSAGLRTGWIGVFEGRRVVPLTLAVNFLPKGHGNDGFKLFADGGLCFGKRMPGKQILMARAGAGQRIMLDRKFALDMSMSVQGVSDHPVDVFDPSRNESVSNANLLRSDCGYMSVNLTIGFCF